MTDRDQKCSERVEAEWDDTRCGLRRALRTDGIAEFGLSFDYVAPGTFRDQAEGYWRYQFSWGGPSDELRFYSSGPNCRPYRIEYWFLDWFDGASVDVTADKVALEAWQYMSDCGVTDSTYADSMREVA